MFGHLLTVLGCTPVATNDPTLRVLKGQGTPSWLRFSISSNQRPDSEGTESKYRGISCGLVAGVATNDPTLRVLKAQPHGTCEMQRHRSNQRPDSEGTESLSGSWASSTMSTVATNDPTLRVLKVSFDELPYHLLLAVATNDPTLRVLKEGPLHFRSPVQVRSNQRPDSEGTERAQVPNDALSMQLGSNQRPDSEGTERLPSSMTRSIQPGSNQRPDSEGTESYSEKFW